MDSIVILFWQIVAKCDHKDVLGIAALYKVIRCFDLAVDPIVTDLPCDQMNLLLSVPEAADQVLTVKGLRKGFLVVRMHGRGAVLDQLIEYAC